jgi:predicted RNase H-like HicB family nuclease
MEAKMDAAEILKRPYARLVVPEEEGGFRAEIPEFPGCRAVGETPAEAIENVNDAALEWLAVVIDKGQPIPEPLENTDFSGKLMLRMPRGLHRRAAFAAERENVSLNGLIVTAVATYLGGPQQAPAAPSTNERLTGELKWQASRT